MLDYFLLGVGTDHYAHHIQPRIPWYRLHRASAFIGDSHPNNRVYRLGFFGGWATYARWTWMRVQHGYFSDESKPFVYPGTK